MIRLRGVKIYKIGDILINEDFIVIRRATNFMDEYQFIALNKRELKLLLYAVGMIKENPYGAEYRRTKTEG